MTKQYFIELADYNIWANDIVQGWLNALADEQWNQTIVSSFNSIRETALHLTGTESVWLDRLNKVEAPVWLPPVFTGTKKEMLDRWNNASHNIKSFVEKFDETKINEKLDFKRLNGDQYSMPYHQVFAHVFNHSTYHRGQLVTMLRQAGFTNVSSTDLLGYYRK